jgi:DNA repair photolyase
MLRDKERRVMQSEQDWLNQEEASKTAYAYFMRTDNDMREMLGPIEKAFDDVTGREMRSRWAKVSMMRGSDRLLETRVYLDPLPHIRVAKGQDLRGWYSSKKDGDNRGQRDRPCETDALLTQPFGGTCEIQCQFCYINSGGRGYRGTGLTTVPMGYGEQVRKQLKTMMSAQAGYFTSFHDPFNSLEEYYHNTQAGAQAFIDEGLPIFFLSRASYPGWAYDMLGKNRHSYMQKSMNTPHEVDWKKLSPRAVSLARHFNEIKEARRRGIYVSIQCNPIIGGVTTHEDIEDLIELLAEAGTNHVIFKFVEISHPSAKAMVERITKAFGDNRAAAFRDLFTENSCGGQKTIQEAYRREGHVRFRAKCQKLKMTSSLCYEYTKRPDGRFVSMGPEFLTADQCHGHRVPFYTRKTPDAPFKPLASCPPSGCLSCADDNAGKPRCGSGLLGAAKALELRDLRQDPAVTNFGRKARA